MLNNNYLWLLGSWKTIKLLSHLINFYLTILLCLLSSFLAGQETTASFLIDSTNQYNFSSISIAQDFQPLSSNIRVKSDESVWLKVVNIEDTKAKYISVGNFDYIEMQVENKKEKLSNGRLTPLSDRVINGFPILFPLSFEDLNKPIYFKIQHKNPLAQETVQAIFLTEEERNENLRAELNRHNKELIFTGVLIGLFMIFLFFSLMAFVFTRKWYYNFYSLYILSNLLLLIISAERFANLDFLFSAYSNLLTGKEPLLFAIIGISYNLFLKKFITATRKSKRINIAINGFIIYEILVYLFTPYIRELFNHHYWTYKLHEIGLLTLFIGTAYFLFNLYKSGRLTLILVVTALFLVFWGGPTLYFLSSMGENQTLFLNPNMPFHLLMIAEVIFFTLILANAEYQAQIALEKEKADLMYKLSDIEKSLLQAQMHPHFVSNCLASIQGFVIKNETKKAAIYLAKFGNLVRLNLEASIDGVLSLKEEMKMLDTYLALEKQRFNNIFNYKINLPDHKNIDKITIPPLLIQPYVENAVLHGVSNKQEGGMINIDFLVEENTLIIKVKDNGVGVNAPKSTTKKSGHKSVGMSITKDRLDRIGYGEKVIIRDLSEENPKLQGTEVTIYMKISNHE